MIRINENNEDLRYPKLIKKQDKFVKIKEKRHILLK